MVPLWFQRVYPRPCGGASDTTWAFQGPPGLSPPVRGSRAYVAATRARDGSIPARAGEPR